ncbi:MAG: hypothetical protein V1929_05030 [bacterium]
MRGLSAIVAFALLTLPALAAERTLLDDEDVWKLYTEPSVRITDVNDNSATLGGVGIGAILNDQLSLGVEVNGLINDIKVDDSGDTIVRSFDWWYAGATVGYTFFASDLIHVSISSLFGGGQMHTHPDPALREESVSFTVIEPRAMVFVNVSETVEFGVGASYRYVNGFELDGVDDDTIDDLAWVASFRVTEF